MKSRTIAIAGSIAALAFAGTPVAALAATTSHPHPVTQSQTDRSRDAKGVRHVDRSPDGNSSTDRNSAEHSRADSQRDTRDL